MKSICTLILCFWQGIYGVAQVCGPIDPTFGDGGQAIGVTLGPQAWINRSRILAQPDGKIIQVGDLHGYNGYNSAFIAVRYNANGTPDGTFGTNGKAISLLSLNDNSMADAVLQNDGKIVIAGLTYSQGESDFMLIRLNSSGNLDPGFGINGQVITSLSSDFDYLHSVGLQPDGKIIVAGTSSDRTNLCQIQDYPFAKSVVVRYKTDGIVDSSFGDNGKIIFNTDNFDDRGNAVSIQPDGKILTSTVSSYDCSCEVDYYGGLYWFCRNSLLVIQRYKSNGSPDTTFGKNGKVIDTLMLNQYSRSRILPQPNGKIVVASGVQNGFMVERYNNDGSRDNSFGVAGKFFTRFGQDGDYLTLNDAVIQPDGKIVLAGGSNYSVEEMLIVRCNVDGTPDNQFYTNGIALFHVGPQNSYNASTSVVMQGAKIIVGGQMSNFQSNNMLIVRLLDPFLLSLGPIVTTGGAVVFCEGKNVTLSANVLGTSQWYRNGSAIDGATGNVYTAASSGIYSLLVNNAGVCGISDTVVVTVIDNPEPDIYENGAVTFCDGENVILSTSNTGSLQWFNNGTPINGATAVNYTANTGGSYSVTAINPGGCSGSSSPVVVTVKSNAVPVINWTGDLNFCEGGNVVLSTTTPDNRQWYKNGSPVSGATGATFTATSSGSYTESNGCKTSDPVVVTVTPNSLKPSITWNGTEFSTNSGFAQYQWLLDGVPIPGATSTTYAPPSSTFGMYNVRVTTAFNCINISDPLPYVVLGVADITIGDTRLRYYPNPTTKTLYLEIAQPTNKKLVAELYDFTGRLLQTQTLTQGHNEISVDGLATGLYGLVINSGKEKTVRKLMVIK